MDRKIQSDPEELKDRLKQPPSTRWEALDQVRATMPLSENAEAEWRRKKPACVNGLKSKES